MAFDLSSAKEVPPQSGGFDLSSAKEVPFMERLSTGAAQGFAEVGNLGDTYGTLVGTGVQEAWRGLGKLAGSKKESDYDARFAALNKRIKDRREWANPEQIDVGVAGNVAGGLAGVVGIPLAPVTGLGVTKDFMDRGESGTRAAVAGLTDSALSTAGVFIPGLGKTIPGKLAMGGAVNSGQGAISDAVANAIAQKQETKDAYQWDDVNRRVSEAVIGAGAGLMTPVRKPAAKPAPKDFNALVEAEKRAQVAENPPMPDTLANRVKQREETALTPSQLKEWKDRQDKFAAYKKEQEQLSRANQAQEAINARQAALEQDVATQAHQDFNAAERARQEQAPTGYADWVEQQRQSANERQPGNNTPMEFESPYPVDANDYPNVLGDAPYQPDNFIDPDTAGQKALSITVADMLNTGEKSEDPFARTNASRTVARNILETDLHPPIIKTRDARRRTGIPRGPRGKQSGAVDVSLLYDLVELFRKRRQMPSAQSLTLATTRLRPEDTIETPQSAATLQQKQTLEQTARAVGLKDTPYTRVTTPEEVIASLQDPNDIPPSYTGARNKLISGSEGMVRLYPKNKLLNFVRSSFQEARNIHESWSKEYLTGDTGINTLLTKLSLDEKSDVVGLLLALDRKQHPLTDSIMSAAGFTPDQISLAKRIRETDDFLYQQKALSLGEQGFDPHTYRQGHIPANFSGAYRALVGHMVDGEFKVTGIAQADTAYGLKQSLDYYKKQGDRYSVVVGKERIGLRSATIRGKNAEAWATLVEQLAKHDPEFAKVKAAADQAGADAAASLYDFHLHEKAKKGVRGSLGDRPWLDRDTNTKQFIEGLIDYFEDGFRYTAYQKPLNETTQLLTNPEVQSKIPNASKYVQQYVNHIKGENLHAVGAALNWGVDTLARSMTLGNTKIQKINHELTHWSSVHMMGGLNLGFYLMQLTQVATGGLPEYAALRQSLQADPNEFVSSVTNTASVFRALGAEMLSGKQVEIPGHMREAYVWAHKNGLFTFSEAELAHQVLQSKTRKTVDAYLTAPIKYGELTTRPVIFMMYADLLHQRGFTGEEGLKIAQNATDFAMANYHPDERPMLYQSLGTLGGLLGALTTYKHNVFTQNVTRAKNVFKQPAAAALAVATGYALYGMGGFPGAQEASQLSELLTGKTLREQLLSDPRETSGWYDGLLTASTGIDFQSRLSMSSALPDSALSAFPHISNIFSVTDKALQFALNPNQGSFQDLATTVTPSGMRGIPEKIFSPDGDMLTKEGMSKYDENRTPEEMKRRIIFGLRPFRERLTDERNYANRIKEAKRMKKLSEAQSRFDRAFLLGDAEGQDRAYGDYLENDGNPDTLWNTTRLQELKKKSVQSEEARRAGTPKNISTLKKYETFTE